MKTIHIDRLTNWYFSKSSLPYWCILIIDVAIIFVSFLFVYQLLHSISETLSFFGLLMANIALYTLPYIISFRVFHTYTGIFRYSSFVDLQRVALAMACGMLGAIAIRLALSSQPDFSHISNLVIIFASILGTLLMWGIRMLVKMLYDISFTSINAKNTFIYGVKSSGIGIAKHIKTEKPTHFLLKGFIADDEKAENHTLMGVQVYPLDKSLPSLMTSLRVNALIVSPQLLGNFRKNSWLQDELIKAGIHIYFMEGEKEWGKDDASSKAALKEVSVEDLLPRDEIQVDMESVARQITGKCILVTGSAGSIGSEIVNQIAAYEPARLILIDQAETPQHDMRLLMKKKWPGIKARTIVSSICEKEHMEAIFDHYRPDYVFHAAAYKHVPMMEDNPSESVFNNIYGTRVMADLSVKYGVKKFVMISTDKAVNPTNVMGCSKRICEMYVQALNKQSATTQFVTTRFGNVLGSNGSVIPLFKEQIENGGPLTVTHPDIIRYFMLIPEACKLVLEAGTKGNGGEIFVFDMGEPVRIADLAHRMIALSGAKNIEVKFTGLRPGEKLYEEVLNEKEKTKPSFHEKIRIAQVREYDYAAVCADIDDLIAISKHFDDMATVKKMKQMVPEYKSNNSVYSILDEQK